MSISAATYLGEVEVTEDNGFPRTLEIYRCVSGMLVGVDSKWKGQVANPEGSTFEPEAVTIHCLYEPDKVHILDPEHIAQSMGGAAP